MRHEGQAALVAFNTASHAALLEPVDTGLAPGTVLRGAFAIEGDAPELIVDGDGRVHLPLAAARGIRVAGRRGTPDGGCAGIDGGPRRRTSRRRGPGDFVVRGSARGATTLKLVVDGDIDRAREVRVAANGRWQAQRRHLVHDRPRGGAPRGRVGRGRRCGLDRPHLPRRARVDAAGRRRRTRAGDDHGPVGRYVYPTGARVARTPSRSTCAACACTAPAAR